MLLMIDNYDSFTFNLVQYFGELGEQVRVFRNDEITVEGIAELKPERLVLSPGPCTPNVAGVSLEVLEKLGPRQPILGVCLGHQSIGQAFGGTIVRAKHVMHGKLSPIEHDGTGLFEGLPSPFMATRYHSLVAIEATLPACLLPNARTDAGELMGARHVTRPLHGVQFHPESVLTGEGKQLLKNFLELSQ